MKKLKQYINEKQNFLIKNKNVLTDYDHYEYHPKEWDELKDIIMDLLKKGETDLNCIDVSNITNMCNLFYNVNFNNITVKDIDISEWNVSNVTNMGGMFQGCEEFNSDLSNWDVSNVNNMYSMFNGCKEFNSDLSNWDVSNVKNMNWMFLYCKKFNSDLFKWNVPKVTAMKDTFKGCTTLIKNNKIPDWYKS